MKKISQTFVFISLLIQLLIPNAFAYAQSGTVLDLLPSTTSIAQDATVAVTVNVRNGIDLNAYDLTILYDPEIVSLESWSHGPFFTNLALIVNENTPGQLHLAATQLASSSVTGDGVLLNLEFQGILPGISTLLFQDVELATKNGGLVIPSLQSAIITVTTVTAVSVTPLPTGSTAKTPTQTNTPAPTSAPANNGNVGTTPEITLTGIGISAASTDTVAPVQQSNPTGKPQGDPSPLPRSTSLVPPPFDQGESDASVENSMTPGLVMTPRVAGDPSANKLIWINALLWILASLLVVALAVLISILFIRKKKSDDIIR